MRAHEGRKRCLPHAARSPGADWAAVKRLCPEGPIGGADVTGDSPKYYFFASGLLSTSSAVPWQSTLPARMT